MNIVSIVMNFLTPDLVGKIASALGLDRALAQKAIGAVVPSILSGLSGLASKPEGARQLANALGQQDSNLLGKFAGLIGGSGQGGLISGGTTALSGLLGGSALSNLTHAVGKFAGIGDAPAKSLLGIVGPAVLGSLAKQKTSNDLDASGLASLLKDQKSNIASAVPSGFASLLGGTGLLDAIGLKSEGKPIEPAAAKPSTTTAAARPATPVRQTPHASAGTASSHWPTWVLTALTGGLFYWYFLGDGLQMRQAALPAAVPAAATASAIRPIMVGDVDVARSAVAATDSLAATLRGIKDTASAQAALTRLQDASTQLNRVNDLSQRLQPDGRRSLAQMIAAQFAPVRPLIATVLAIPGLPDAVKTTLTAIQGRMDGLSKA